MEKCLVLLSGGQDSATCLALALRLAKEVYTISFDYGQKHRRELECSKTLSTITGCKEHFVIPISSLPYLGNSALLDGSDVSKTHPLNNNLPASFVPGRNYIFLGLAAAKAFQLGIKDVFTGVCQTDYSGYPDCREVTIRCIELSLSLAMDFSFVIHTPLMHKSKAGTVLLMQRLNKLDLYAYTHTCYNGTKTPCGVCPACILRAKGFKEAGIKDPLVERFKNEKADKRTSPENWGRS